MAAGKRRFLYETFFDCRTSRDDGDDGRFDVVDYLVNHEVVRRFGGPPPDPRSSTTSVHSTSLVSSVFGDAPAEFGGRDGMGRRRRSLHLSPRARSKFCEMLSPISDKSQELVEPIDVCHPLLECRRECLGPAPAPTAVVYRPWPIESRPGSLLARPDSGRLDGSDSGISISAQSLLSHETAPFKPNHHSLANSHDGLLTDVESLPFLMPKLHRAKALPCSSVVVVERPPRPSSVGLSLTLPFPAPALRPPPVVVTALVDPHVDLLRQSWYHGSISRRDAESRLRREPEGTFLVRDSLACLHDFFLVTRCVGGYLHVQIISSDEFDRRGHSFQLAGLTERDFDSVAAVVNHCARIGIYGSHHPPVFLKYPLREQLV